MKYATQNMPNIVSLENGNEAAVKHKRTWQFLFLTVLVRKPAFSKIHSEKLCLRWPSPSDACGRVAVWRKKRLGFQEIWAKPQICLHHFICCICSNKCRNAQGIFFFELSGQQRIFCVKDPWTERIILEGVKLIQTIILAYRNTMGLNKSVVTGYVAL